VIEIDCRLDDDHGIYADAVGNAQRDAQIAQPT
jgi:hypothetical protein